MEALSPNTPRVASSVETSTHSRSKSSIATKEQYANAISSHASRSKEDFLFNGENYRKFSQFLNPPPLSSGISLPTTTSASEPWPYLVVHTYGTGANFGKHIFDDTTKAQTFLSTNPISSECSQVVFMRGFPSSDWINTLGALYKVNPEFFRRHLDFLQNPPCYDLPALPSSSRHFVNLKITTIGVRGKSLGLSDVQSARKKELEEVKKYQNQVVLNKDVGDSMVRKFSNHDETNFTLEQNISCYVKNYNGGFIAIIWMDIGKNLEACPDGPWKQPNRSSTTAPRQPMQTMPFNATFQNSFIPVIQHRRKGPLKPVSSTSDSGVVPHNLSRFHDTFQNANLLSTNYGSTLDAEVAPIAAWYALSEVFSFTAHSESQFLNLIQTQLTREMREYDHEKGHSIENLRYHRGLLEEHIVHISEVLDLVRNRSYSDWSTTKENPQVVTELLSDLQCDYEKLLSRAKALVSRCNIGSQAIMENATLEESRKSRLQAAVYGRLSTLAFFFIPSSLVTGVFGMNFVEFGTGSNSIWLFASVIVPVLVGSTILAFPRLVSFKTREKVAKVDILPAL